MSQALTELGWKVAGCQFIQHHNLRSQVLELAFRFIESNSFNAFQDNPWPIIFKDLDVRYPGSKFVVTTRNVDDWYESNLNHFGDQTTPMREFIYGEGCGSPMGNELAYKRRFKSHYSSVEQYFSRQV